MAIWEELDRLYTLEEFYFHRLFSAEYAYLSEEHHAEADGCRKKLWDVQQEIKKLGGKPKSSVTPPKDAILSTEVIEG